MQSKNKLGAYLGAWIYNLLIFNIYIFIALKSVILSENLAGKGYQNACQPAS